MNLNHRGSYNPAGGRIARHQEQTGVSRQLFIRETVNETCLALCRDCIGGGLSLILHCHQALHESLSSGQSSLRQDDKAKEGVCRDIVAQMESGHQQGERKEQIPMLGRDRKIITISGNARKKAWFPSRRVNAHPVVHKRRNLEDAEHVYTASRKVIRILQLNLQHSKPASSKIMC